jgi:excisionase family DNA binding protein
MALLTLARAAQALGISAATLRVQVHRGKLGARKYGRDWLVDEAEVERYRVESRKGPQSRRQADDD